jgi:hypothetical protein
MVTKLKIPWKGSTEDLFKHKNQSVQAHNLNLSSQKMKKKEQEEQEQEQEEAAAKQLTQHHYVYSVCT